MVGRLNAFSATTLETDLALQHRRLGHALALDGLDREPLGRRPVLAAADDAERPRAEDSVAIRVDFVLIAVNRVRIALIVASRAAKQLEQKGSHRTVGWPPAGRKMCSNSLQGM